MNTLRMSPSIEYLKSGKIIIAIVLFFINSAVSAQINKNTQGEIIIGKVDSLYSQVLKEQREFWVYTPEDFDASKRYPIIYVLNAEGHFHAVTGMLTRLHKWQMPKSIVVGIRGIDGIKDYTPSNVKSSRHHNTETSGGAHNFAKFLNEELHCLITDSYPTEHNATIVGHSTAGLFVIYSFLNNESVFDNFIAIDPSLWWDKEDLVKQSQKLISNGNYKDKSLYVAVANSIGERMDTVKVRRDKSEITEQIRANLKFHDVLVQHKSNLDFEWEYFKNEDHGSIIIPGQYNGFRSVFSWFPFKEMWRFNTPQGYSAKELTEPFYKHYKKLSSKMKRDMKPDWALVNDIASFMLEGHDLPKKALAYLEMNVDFYPDSSKSYVALGNFYKSQKKKEEAIKYYKKAIEIDNNTDAQRKLDKMTNR